jgi:hypothetical protein
MRSFHRYVLLVSLSVSLLAAVDVAAQDLNAQEMRSLDEQVQQIKSDVLGIAADLGRLEERLLYPSHTHLAGFVSIEEGQKFRLDAMRIDIDGALATHYIYGFKELDALQQGGTQRIYTGNLPTGAHELQVSISGKTPSGNEFESKRTFAFTKDVEPKLLGIELAGPEAIELGEW